MFRTSLKRLMRLRTDGLVADAEAEVALSVAGCGEWSNGPSPDAGVGTSPIPPPRSRVT